MPGRELRPHGSESTLRDLLAAALAALVLHEGDDRPVYVASPWLTDFPLFPNQFRQFAALFADHAGDPHVPVSACLTRLARRRRVRVVTAASSDFSVGGRSVHVRRTAADVTPQGILTPLFYLEGALNLTGGGVFVRGEWAVYHAGSDEASRTAIDLAYPEFDRLWESLS